MSENNEEMKTKFEPRRGPYLMIPYCPQEGTAQHQALIDLYFRLKSEGLNKVVFHENPGVSLLEFMNFFSGPKTLLQILAIIAEEKVVDICGMAWLADMTSCSSGILIKGTGSFLFFKNYQKPAYTDPFRDLIFNYWFDVLKLQTLVGLTPSLNRAASIFVKRLGMKEIGRVPNYTTYDNQVCDGIISWMSQEEYHASRRG
jgi:hypothetical protein